MADLKLNAIRMYTTCNWATKILLCYCSFL